MKSWINYASRYWKRPDLGLLLIRFAIGMVFFMHGWGKIHNIPMVEGMMTHFGMGAWVGDFIAWLEVIGGVALVLGVFTRVFAVALGIEMFVAILLTGLGKGYQAHEYELVLMLVSAGIALAGSGRYALYSMECHDCGAMLCTDGKCSIK